MAHDLDLDVDSVFAVPEDEPDVNATISVVTPASVEVEPTPTAMANAGTDAIAASTSTPPPSANASGEAALEFCPRTLPPDFNVNAGNTAGSLVGHKDALKKVGVIGICGLHPEGQEAFFYNMQNTEPFEAVKLCAGSDVFMDSEHAVRDGFAEVWGRPAGPVRHPFSCDCAKRCQDFIMKKNGPKPERVFPDRPASCLCTCPVADRRDQAPANSATVNRC